jgi:hypothetical protein
MFASEQVDTDEIDAWSVINSWTTRLVWDAGWLKPHGVS